MFEKEKYGITFSVDARVELIFGILSKLKKENYNLLLEADPTYEDDDFIESFDENYHSDYANKLYDFIDFNKYPKLLKWATLLIGVPSEDFIPNIIMMINDDFKEKNVDRNDKYFKEFFTDNSYEEFINDIYDFVSKENYMEFYKYNFEEYDQMIEESTAIYPSNFDISDIEKYYGQKPTKYPVIYSIFFSGGFGPIADGIPYCFKGLWIDNNGKYFESIKGIINLFHEYSHSFINPLVDKYWGNFENVDGFIKYSIDNHLHKIYQSKPQTLYYEYYVRAMAYIMATKYEDVAKELEKYNKLGFIKSNEIIDFISNNYKIGDNYERFFVTELIPYTNELTSNLNIDDSLRKTV